MAESSNLLHPETLNPKLQVCFVVGPTASGKSDWALQLVEQDARERGERAAIVNCDSIQVYQGLQIGSAMPTTDEMKRVPHYLFGYVPKGERTTAGQYARSFFEKMGEIQFHFDKIYVVGGTGFYFQAIEKGIYDIGAANEVVRGALEQRLIESGGPEELHEELKRGDPESAARISVNDHYRLARAVEILRTHGRSLTQIQADFAKTQKPFPWALTKIGIRGSRETFLKRVELRTQKMLQAGLVDEVRGLVSDGYGDWEALQSVGYRETLRFLQGDAELKSLEQLSQLITQNTMKLVKKQRTWFQRYPEIQWREL